MSVKRGLKWPEKRLEIINKLGEKNVLLLNVTSQNIRCSLYLLLDNDLGTD